MKISEMMEHNKDQSYYINFTRLKTILEAKRNYIKNKQESENCLEIFENMERLSLLSKNAYFFNPSLDVLKNPNGLKYIFLPIDNENTVNAFNFETKRIDKINIDLGSINLPYIPKYSRSINILGKVYVMGGEIFNQITSSFFELEFSFPENGQKIVTIVKMLNPLEHGRSGHSIINVDNHKIFVVSGAYNEKSCEFYEFAKEKWTLFSGLNEDRIGSSLLLKNNEDLFCFFGKKWDMSTKKWAFLDTGERVNLYEKFPRWHLINFRNLYSDNLKRRAFSGVITTPNNRVLLLGGQIKEDIITKPSNNVVEINIEDLSISPFEVNLPKPTTFIDNNFYIFHNNNIQFDIYGNIIFYSSFYKEIWLIENSITTHHLDDKYI